MLDRELHKWEPEEDVKTVCERLVGILINDEPDVDNLKELEIPAHVQQALHAADRAETDQAQSGQIVPL